MTARVEQVRVGALALRLIRPDLDRELAEAIASGSTDPPYWAELWPSAHALARLLGERDLRGLRVIEVGCGLALPSLVARARGARVLATDRSAHALANAERNGLETRLLDLADPPAGLRFDLAVAADVLYEPALARAVASTLPTLADELVIAVPRRPGCDERVAAVAPGWPRTSELIDGVEVISIRRPSEATRGSGT